MKKIILMICLATVLFGDTEHWKVFKVSNIKIYTVFGENIPGNTFGFTKLAKTCDITLMWLSVFTLDANLIKYDGKFVKFDFETEYEKFTISVSFSIMKRHSIYSLLSYNFVLGDKFVEALKNSKKIKISINPNQEIAKYFQEKPIIFNIEGFKKILTSANHQCQKDTIDQK